MSCRMLPCRRGCREGRCAAGACASWGAGQLGSWGAAPVAHSVRMVTWAVSASVTMSANATAAQRGEPWGRGDRRRGGQRRASRARVCICVPKAHATRTAVRQDTERGARRAPYGADLDAGSGEPAHLPAGQRAKRRRPSILCNRLQSVRRAGRHKQRPGHHMHNCMGDISMGGGRSRGLLGVRPLTWRCPSHKQ